MTISTEKSAEPERSALTARRILASYLELAKARLGTLVVLTALAGYVLGSRGDAQAIARARALGLI